MRLDINVKNGRTDRPIEGAEVTVSAEQVGSEESADEFDLDDVDEDGEFVRSMQTVSNEEYSGRAAFEIASWVTAVDVEVTHERFEPSGLDVTPGLRDKHKLVELTPNLSDVTLSISEHFHEPAQILIEPADEVVESLYDSATDIEIMPGDTETFSFISGRYRFILQNPPDNYVGETSVSKNLEARDSPRIDFTGMDLEMDSGTDVETDTEENVDPEPMGTDGPPEDSSDGVRRKLRELMSIDGSISDPKPESDPVTDEDVENGTMGGVSDQAPSDDAHDAGAEEGQDENAEDTSVDEGEDEINGEAEDEADGEAEGKTAGLGALFN
jgi:hypothetical protein